MKKLLFLFLLSFIFRCSSSSQSADDSKRLIALWKGGTVQPSTKLLLSIKGSLKDSNGKPMSNVLLNTNAAGLNSSVSVRQALNSPIRCTDYDINSGKIQCIQIIQPDLFTTKSSDSCYYAYYGNASNKQIQSIAKFNGISTGKSIKFLLNSSIPSLVDRFTILSCKGELLSEKLFDDTVSGTITDSNGNYDITLEAGKKNTMVVQTPFQDVGEVSVDLSNVTTKEAVQELAKNSGAIPFTTSSNLQTSIEVKGLEETTTQTVATSTNTSQVVSLDPAVLVEIANTTTTTTTTPTNTVVLPSIAYSPSSFTFTSGSSISAITPTITGTISSCTTNPALPSGLSLDNTTCSISGTPSTTQGAISYTITAGNSSGSTTATISITINAAPPILYSVGGTISGLTGTVVLRNNGSNDLSISTNGSFTFSTQLSSGSAYLVTVFTQPAGQACSISSGSGTISTNVTNITINCITIGLAVNTTAITVYGQNGSFTTNTINNGGISANSLKSPQKVILDSSGNLYVSDQGNHRILYYPAGTTTATVVYGQADFISGSPNRGGTIAANTLNNPFGIALDSSNNLYVADETNNRVLYFPVGNTTATRVYGQNGSFTTGTANNGGISANSLSAPVGVAIDSTNNIYIADKLNHRILYYTGVSTTATRVYGQNGSFTTGTANNGGVSANSLNTPLDVRPIGSNVYISDTFNHRMLHYLSTSTTATTVYGQADFISGSVNRGGTPTANSFNNVGGILVDLYTGKLYAADYSNARVLVFAP